MGQGEWFCGYFYYHYNPQLAGHVGKNGHKLLILQDIITILSYHFPFKETRGLFPGWCWCGLCWMIVMTDGWSIAWGNISRIVSEVSCSYQC